MEGPRRILREPAPDIGEERDDVEPELVELLFELLAKERAHRPPDAGVVASRLERILAAVIAAEGPADTSAYVKRLCAAEEAALRAKISSPAALPPLPASRRQRRPRRGRIARVAAVSAALSFVAVLAIAAGRRWVPPEAAARPGAPPVTSLPPQASAEETLLAPPLPAAAAEAGRSAPAARRRSLRRKPARSTPTGAKDCRAAEASGSAGDRQLELRCLVDVRR